ncbi:S8 family serine peptidase [Elioraea rosea]|uniref:S8 family serine peptidase n=1 Tax=Elioraea rosea TaxID=2492390 RepID=UPI0011844CC4|nr:S8 family serine peptidase [Elioraea rosea]
MRPLDLVRLTPLMVRTRGRPEVVVALVDGPVALHHPSLGEARITPLPGPREAVCADHATAACRHGTFVAGILAGDRGGGSPAIAPDCTLLLSPVFSEAGNGPGAPPSAAPRALAAAIEACIKAGARIVNVSAAIEPGAAGETEALTAALDHAARRDVIVVAAAGNVATIGSSAITAHPCVIPVIGCDGAGRPLAEATLGATIGRNGLAAPGDKVESLAADGASVTLGGSSAAAPFVTGAIALLWSEFPRAPARLVRAAVTRLWPGSRRSVVPPMLDAWGAWQAMQGAAR